MKVPPHFLIIIPGFMGSKLRKKSSGEVVWADFSTLPLNPFHWSGWLEKFFHQLAYPNDDLEAFQIMDEVLIASPWVRQEHYEQLFAALHTMGYRLEGSEEERTVYSFPYDWRQDNRLSAQQLGEAIQRWQHFHPQAKVWIIAHSNGGNVARWYIEQLGGKEVVERLFLLGTPNKGTPKAMQVFIDGLNTLYRRQFSLFGLSELTRTAIHTFPSIYQLLPFDQPFLFDENNQPINILEDNLWLPQQPEMREHALTALQAGADFYSDLGDQNSIETICVFGCGHSTTHSGIVSFGANHSWQKVKWIEQEAGDGTVPQRSAVFPSAQRIYPFPAAHGELYAHPSVLSVLSWELYEKYSLAKQIAFKQPQLNILFEVQPQVVSPGEPLYLSLSILRQKAFTNPLFDKEQKPLHNARVQAQMVWRQALPASNPILRNLKPLSCRLTAQEEGHYTGIIPAPPIEGIYTIKGLFIAESYPAVLVSDTVIVENELNYVQT